jgi:hypothetical protein
MSGCKANFWGFVGSGFVVKKVRICEVLMIFILVNVYVKLFYEVIGYDRFEIFQKRS